MGFEPGSNQYYTAPVQTARAAAALPAAGAWDAAPLELYCAGYRICNLYIVYTRAAAGGAMDFQLQVSPRSADAGGVEDWFAASAYDVGAVAAGVDTASAIQREVITYTSTAAGAEDFVFAFVLGPGVERIRIPCRESGVVGNPGAVHIVAHFSVV